ncbi:MAG: hypothetical protein NTV86_18670 [Planctomycetota bacterium]|nr:hypothetical protein [Planctomycetota bacterium]
MHTRNLWMVSRMALGVMVAIASFAAGDPAAQEPQEEDLSACKLPHGGLVIPDRNAQEARAGYILRFSDGTLNRPSFPSGAEPRSAVEFIAAVADAKTGDLVYSSLKGGGLCSMSGRATDLGSKSLHDLSGVVLKRPPQVYGETERSVAGEATPGLIEGVQEGHCYLIETLDGKGALVRIVRKHGRLADIQYVYQPDKNTWKFDIPKAKPAPATAPAPAATTAPASRPATRPSEMGGAPASAAPSPRGIAWLRRPAIRSCGISLARWSLAVSWGR